MQNGETFDGTLRITKGDNLQVSLLSPQSLSGVEFSSDGAGNPSEYIISFSGIQTTIPKSVLSQLSLTFSMFAPEIPSLIKHCSSDKFKESKDEFSQQGLSQITPITLNFKNNDIEYYFTYDATTGTPLLFIACHNNDSVTLKFTKFKTQI